MVRSGGRVPPPCSHFAGCCSNFPPWRSQSCRLSALIVAHSSMQPTGAWDLPWGLPVLASQLHVLRLKGAAGVNIWIRPFLVPTESARMSRPPICGVSGLLYPPIFIDPLCPARDRWYGGDWNAWMIQVELLKWQEFPLFSICLFTQINATFQFSGGLDIFLTQSHNLKLLSWNSWQKKWRNSMGASFSRCASESGASLTPEDLRAG